MKIISLNANGIRAAARKGVYEWLAEQDADYVCLQETKAQKADLMDEMYHPENYHCFYNDAVKRGYSGVAIYAKQKPMKVVDEFGWDIADDEGRYLQVDHDNLSVISLYLPSGSSKEARQLVKYEFLDRFMARLKEFKKEKRDYIICGDWNIAHTKKDIKNWRGNQKNSGFLPEERAWMDELLGPVGYVDAFRVINQEEDQYTWWSNRGRAWDNNVGWRIDYQVISPNLQAKVCKVDIYKEQRFSDHAPLIIEYK